MKQPNPLGTSKQTLGGDWKLWRQIKKKKPAVTLPGSVEKVIPARYEPEKAQISVEGADPLYDEIRGENALQDEEGEQVKLNPGDDVDVTEADANTTNSKRPSAIGVWPSFGTHGWS